MNNANKKIDDRVRNVGESIAVDNAIHVVLTVATGKMLPHHIKEYLCWRLTAPSTTALSATSKKRIAKPTKSRPRRTPTLEKTEPPIACNSVPLLYAAKCLLEAEPR